ncbi:photosystem II repair protein Psb32 [Myxacorys almedinensis]|uniref:YgcG family protein n=1 Tax=Myxacorys almedinensis A TaxID=2690445 RepID=A0A8J8CMA0_9CYAN|nr:TPM domain-containing protein [Myxacorys almedinensis]NDJ17027.1 YgcG family protein [Myxacorys almedinensis A]
MKKLLPWFYQRWLLPLPLIVLSCFWMAPAIATSLYDVPIVSNDTHVVDLADIVSRINEGKLNTTLNELADKTGQKVHYVTIRRLDYDETIDSFTEKLFQQWFPTPEVAATQTLIVVDSLTNNSSIYTGSKVKELMPDAIAQSVSQETIQEPLRQGNRYNQAFLDASDRLVAVLSGEADPGPPEVKDTVQVEGTFATPEETQKSNAIPWVIGLLLAATIVPMATYYWYVR